MSTLGGGLDSFPSQYILDRHNLLDNYPYWSGWVGASSIEATC
jgi:hypothetical protein